MSLSANNAGPQIGDRVLGGSYTLLEQVKGSVGSSRIHIGRKGVCRYCGCRDVANFKNISHTFPESLGNKWIVSLDECDGCNKVFSIYDDALSNSVSPFLTLGGVKGKDNKIRQTGRSQGTSVLSRQAPHAPSRISVLLRGVNASEHVFADPATGKIRMLYPVAGVPFRPLHAYKALVKMAIALLPEDELKNYKKLRAWILDPNDNSCCSLLEVGLSFASVGNAPQLAVGVLLRRTVEHDVRPRIVFVFSAGSVCLQIYLRSDSLDDKLPLNLPGILSIEWSNVIVGYTGSLIRLNYGAPVHMDWRLMETCPQPVESVTFDFCPKTCVGQFTPNFRKSP
jgi:hypothetical protein